MHEINRQDKASNIPNRCVFIVFIFILRMRLEIEVLGIAQVINPIPLTCWNN